MTEQKYGKYLRTIGFNVLNSIQDTEECMNDTLLKAWNAIPPARPDRLSSFLGKIMRHQAIDQYRHYQADKRFHLEVVLDELQTAIPSTIEDTVIIQETINDFLRNLKKENRMIFIRRYWFGDSIKNISTRYQISQSKVKTSLFRTRNELNHYLMEENTNE
ncbi:MAG: RNA polymerase sigma factor [Clostridia bacterium]|nr:RNA polymerase sigma factor [Clostridia bacterium]